MSGVERDNRGQPEERVITIGWQVVVIPLLVVVFLVGGFYIGRQLGTRGAAQAPVSTPPAVAVNVVPEQAVQVPDQSGQVLQIPAQGNDPTSRYNPDVVYDLPRRSHPLVGQPAPDFTMTQLDTGETVSLSDFAGQPVLVDFWATWCPPCIIEMPWFEELHQKYQDDGLVVLGFNVGEKVPESMAEDTIRQFVAQHGLTFPILIGEENFDVQRAWGVSGYPAAFFVTADGTIADFHPGMFPNQITLESRLEETILGGGEAAGEAVGETEG